MSLKKPRMHQCGFTNIDFRTKGDFESLKLYEPWKIPKEFGTMGKSGYYPPFSVTKRVFSVSKSLNKLKDIIHGSPDPHIYPGAVYYKKNHIQPKTVQEFRNERVANLDESGIGKEKFTGDSMMISDIYRYRNDKKNKKSDILDKKLMKKDYISRIEKAKSIQNKEATQETQLVKIEANETLDDKIDINKIQEIRLALRRRYASRKDIRKIFKEWDTSALGEITVYSAHDMINRLSIPINYNETRALIASSNTRGTETLNLEEFFHLIFSDNEALKVDLKKLEFKDEKLFSEGADSENIKNNMKKSIIEMNKNNEVFTIKQQIRTRTSIIKNAAVKNKINANNCSKEDFIFLMRTLKFPEKYYRDILMDTLFNSYLNDDNKTMNLNNFCNDCINIKEANNFTQFKDIVLENFENKIDKQLEQCDNDVKELQNEKNSRLNLVEDLKKQIIEKKEIEKKILEQEEKNLKEVLNPQPSTEFINKVYKDHRKMYEELNKVEDSFCIKPNISYHIQGKTRFNGLSQRKNTFYMIQQDPLAGSYVTEKQRFDISDGITDFIRKEREQQKLKELNRLKSIRKFETMREDACKTMEKIFEQRDNAYQNKRTIRQYDYELLNKIRNEFVE